MEPSGGGGAGGRSDGGSGAVSRAPAQAAWNSARIAPLEDEEVLEAVQRGLAEIVIPELRLRGASGFVVSQAYSLMSMVSFVRRGLPERQLARARCEEELAELGASPATGDDAYGGDVGEARKRILRRRLEADIAGHCEP